MKTVAIIPARGGSKGIARKNMRMLAGKPLVAWTIDAALAAQRVELVVVSTDDKEIAEETERRGARVIWRPEQIAGDQASSEDALLHVLETLRSEGREPDATAFLQCTSPLTLPVDIDNAIALLEEENADTVLAVTDFHYFVWHHNEQGEAVGINHEKQVRLLRQQREPQYLETGAIYVMNTRGFLQARHRFFGRIALYPMPHERCLEIDDARDLLVADTLLRLVQDHRRAELIPDGARALALDFDGVFTDNRVMVNEHGEEAVLCNRGDGLGLRKLRETGWPLLVLSSEQNPVVAARCAKLGIACRQVSGNKLDVLLAWGREQGVVPEQMVYLGNDVNDVACLQAAGCGVAVADAQREARDVADIVLRNNGGCGAIRELCDYLAQQRPANEKEHEHESGS